MPLINSVYGLPNYSVDRLSESEGRNRQRDRKKDQKEEEPKSDQKTEDKSSSQEGDLSLVPSESSQALDSETVVKLLDNQLKNQNQTENTTSGVSNRYDHVKNLTDSSKINREI